MKKLRLRESRNEGSNPALIGCRQCTMPPFLFLFPTFPLFYLDLSLQGFNLGKTRTSKNFVSI